MVIGEFEVTGVLYDRIDELWNSTNIDGGVSRQFFYSYFLGKEQGYAIKIGNPRLYRAPRKLQQEYGVQPPQSFLYLR
jgi:predicted transcriptional regulator